MSTLHFLTAICILALSVTACVETDPNSNTYSQEVIAQDNESIEIPTDFSYYTDSVYVPIYSDIYSRSKDSRFLLTATLSIRNTSYSDSLVVSQIDYFDTRGDLVTQYLNSPVVLNPMASIDYVIEEDDQTGGSGANFIVVWSAKTKWVKPIIQAVMISTNGQQGVAFTTEGVSIKKSKL